MQIELEYTKSIEENASHYYDKAKKAKKKLQGVQTAIEKAESKLKQLQKTIVTQSEQADAVAQQAKARSQRKWFEKFRWFYTSKGHLAIGGRDTQTNELVIKKHTEPNDLVFHTDMAGSPFFVLKLDQKSQATDEEIKEVASATFLFSRAAKQGLATSEVFYVKPNQVTKTANSGESLGTGAFVIRGKTTYVDFEQTNIGVYVLDHRVIAAPLQSIDKTIKPVAIVQSGNLKPSDAAKKVMRILKAGASDDIIRALPSGEMTISMRE